MEPTKVYAVIGGFDYDGDQFTSLRLFDRLSAAHAYMRDLEKEGYDYTMWNALEVSMESALAIA